MTQAPLAGWPLPPFYCPIAPAMHPKAAELERSAIEWVDAAGICRDEADRAWNVATHATDFSCGMIPEGPEELVLLFILWNHWAFALDDAHDAGSAPMRTADIIDLNIRISRALEAPGSGLLNAGPFAVALADLVDRTRALTTPVQLRRLGEGVRDWLLGAAWQASNTERGVMPTLAEYIAGRLSSVGTRFDATFVEIANGIEVPGEQLYTDAVQAATEAAGFIVGCDNDLLSYAKENSQETPAQNIVNVLAHHNRCSPQQALPAALAIRDRTMMLFLRLRGKIAEHADPVLRCYVDGLGHYIRSNIQWSNTAPRYASPRNLHELPVPGATLNVTFTDRPIDPGTGPLPVPVAAWWWQALAAD